MILTLTITIILSTVLHSHFYVLNMIATQLSVRLLGMRIEIAALELTGLRG